MQLTTESILTRQTAVVIELWMSYPLITDDRKDEVEQCELYYVFTESSIFVDFKYHLLKKYTSVCFKHSCQLGMVFLLLVILPGNGLARCFAGNLAHGLIRKVLYC